jgi:Acetyl-CoA carboxylase beta subunit
MAVARFLYIDDLKENLSVCQRCGYHFRVPVWERIEQLADDKKFEELFWELLPADPLKFVVEDTYPERLEAAAARSGLTEAIVTGLCKIKGNDVALGAMSFDFFGGSMGCVVGEKIVRLVEMALSESLPIVIVASSGGARMQEGILSLMQLGKISSAFSEFNRARGFFVSVLTEPVFGSAAASFGMIGDVILAEPGARIGFAGRRVVESTINQTLPSDFQTAEYLLEHGQIDMVVNRKDLADTIGRLIKIHSGTKKA